MPNIPLAIAIGTTYNASGATAAKRDLGALDQAGQKAEGAFASLQTSVSGGIQSIGSFGTALLPLSAGLAAIGVTGIKSMADFSQTLENTQVIIGATEAEMASLTQQALDLGASSVFSSNELALAQKELAKAGLDTNQILDSMSGVLNLAAAGQVDMATAAGLTTSALNSFNLEATESGRVADLLAGAANASLADISDLGAGMRQAGFAFAEANWPIEDLATSLAILTDRGLTGSDAGTALKNAWTRMIAPTKEAKGVMDELGISFFDAAGNMKSLPDIIDNLNLATAGLTEEQRANALSTVFLSDGYKALAPLLDEGTVGFAKYKSQVTEVGAAQKVADANMRGLAGAFEYISGSVDSAMKSAFLPWEDFLSSSIISVADFITSLSQLPAPVVSAAVAFGAVLAVAGPLAAALPYIAGAFGALLSPIGLVVVAVGALAAAWAADLGGIQGKTTEVIDALQPALVRLGGYLDMIKGGDWSGLQTAVFADVGSLLQKASATIEAFSWSDWIADVLDWGTYIGQLAWDTFLTLVDWRLYIWRLEWSAFVSVLKWTSDIVGKVDWTAFIDNLADWGIYVGTVAWDSFITALEWTSDIVGQVDWDAYITELTDWGMATGTVVWGDFIAALEWTRDIVGAVDWGTHITNLTDWSMAAGAVVWSDFISAFEWTADIIGKVDWGAILNTTIDWGTYIAVLSWEAILPTLTSWGDYITSLDWTKIITTGIDWSLWIVALPWNAFVKLLDWATIVGAFVWTEWISKLSWADFVAAFTWTSDYVSKLNWADFVAGVLDWGTYISSLPWADWIGGALEWSSYVASFTWESFVSKLEWPIIATFDWGTWVDSLDWTSYVGFVAWDSFITDLEWPSLDFDGWSTWIPELAWPSVDFDGWSTWVPNLSWPSIPQVHWSDFVPNLSWPSITWPGWGAWIPSFPGWPDIRSMVANIINGRVGSALSSSNVNPALATPGTPLTSGNITTGGRSAMIAVPPPPQTIYVERGRMATVTEAPVVNVTVNATVSNDFDLERNAYRIAEIIQRRSGRR